MKKNYMCTKGSGILVLLQFLNQVLKQPSARRAYLVKLNSHAGFTRASYRAGQAQPHCACLDHDFHIAGSGEWLVRLDLAAVLAQIFQLAFAFSRGWNAVDHYRAVTIEPARASALFWMSGSNGLGCVCNIQAWFPGHQKSAVSQALSAARKKT